MKHKIQPLRAMVLAGLLVCSLCMMAQTRHGDITGDGQVDIADVNKVINIMLGKGGPVVWTYTVNGVSFDMVEVAGGTFTMGATSEQGSEATDSEKPAHEVTLDTYAIAKTEVTQELWQAVMGSNPSTFFNIKKKPVEMVTWDDCQTFITKLNQITGKNFRLPTEAEWEFAARGGNMSKGYKYAGSNYSDQVAWYWYNIPSQDEYNGSYGTQPVATKAPNELGLYDMSGNAWEWCQDWYGAYSSEPQTNPTGPTSGTERVIRGGGFANLPQQIRVSFRYKAAPSTQDIISFRLAQ